MLYIYILEHLIAFGVCYFAWRRGGIAERIAGAWLAVNVAVFAVAVAFDNQSPVLSLVFDGAFSIGLLPLAMFTVSWGIGIMCLVQTGSFAVQALYLLSDKPADHLFVTLTTLACWGDIFALFGSTIASIVYQRRLAALAAKSAANLAAVPV